MASPKKRRAAKRAILEARKPKVEVEVEEETGIIEEVKKKGKKLLDKILGKGKKKGKKKK